MKKRNNRLIVLTLIGIIFIVLFGIFILNYSKDDYSFSILEKKWINDKKNNIIDVSIYNDVPIYGNIGKGIAFDILNDFTESYGVSFNKVSYSINSNANLKDVAFRIIDSNINLGNNDILLYEDNYVLVSTENTIIDRITDIQDIQIAVLSSDMTNVSNFLSEAKNVSYLPMENITSIEEGFKNNEINYAFIPCNLYIDLILKNDLNILFTLSDMSKKYVLTINDNTFFNIFKKYYLKFEEEKRLLSYKNNFLDEFFLYKNISEVDRMGYNANSYNVGYITYMPYTELENGQLIGILSNYLAEFEDIFEVDFKLIAYDNISDLKKALSSGELDLVFANFNSNGLNVDTISTKSLFKEEYVVLSKDIFVINSIKSLKDKEVKTIKDSYINDLLTNNGITYKVYNNTDDLLRNVGDSIVIIDKDTYDYYKVRKFSDYYELFSGILPYQYSFLIRDVNKNTVFAEMFCYYVEAMDYNTVKYEYNTTSSNYNYKTLIYFVVSVVIMLIIISLIVCIRKKKNKESILRNNDKIKYIDTMTSLKNRSYLNLKIKEWDDNVIYPQGFVIVDLNNIKDINDSRGHEEGDIVIKKAASILIVNQEPNTDIIRTDGNEFLIYMVGYQEKDVVSYTRKIYKELKELPYGYGATIGYSMIMDDIKTVDDAINEATIDMRRKKEQADNNG